MSTNVIMKCSQAVQGMYGRHTPVGSALRKDNKQLNFTSAYIPA